MPASTWVFGFVLFVLCVLCFLVDWFLFVVGFFYFVLLLVLFCFS